MRRPTGRKASPLNPYSLASGGVRPARCLGLAPSNTQQEPEHLHVFSLREWWNSPNLHSLFHLLSGDVEQNPGPTYPCPVCRRAYSRRRGAVQCSRCRQWLCLSRHCSALTHYTHYTSDWACRLCLSQTPPAPRVPSPPTDSSLARAPPPRAHTLSSSSSSMSPPQSSATNAVVGPPLPVGPPPTSSSSSRASSLPSPSFSISVSSSRSGGPRLPLPVHSLKILQWNANGIGNKKEELKELLARLGIHVALLQESKLRPHSKTPSFPGYTTLRVDRPSGDGGVVFSPW